MRGTMEPITVDHIYRELDNDYIALDWLGRTLREVLEIHTNHGDCRHPEPNEHIRCKAANTCDECGYAWPCRTVEAILKMKESA